MPKAEMPPPRTDFRAEAAFHWLDPIRRHVHALTSNLPLQKLAPYIGGAAVADPTSPAGGETAGKNDGRSTRGPRA